MPRSIDVGICYATIILLGSNCLKIKTLFVYMVFLNNYISF